MIPIARKVDIGVRAEQVQARIEHLVRDFADVPVQRLIQLEYVRQVLEDAMQGAEQEVLKELERIQQASGKNEDRWLIKLEGALFESTPMEGAYCYARNGDYRKLMTQLMWLKKGLRDATQGRKEGPTVPFDPTMRKLKVHISGNLQSHGAKEQDLA